MKKIVSILLFILVSCSLSLMAQVVVTTGFTAPNFVYTHSANDTLYASDTLIYSIRISHNDVQNLKIKQTVTKVTGTVSDTVYFYGSFDGTTEDVALDSIFNSNISTGKKYLTKTSWATFNYPYLIIKNWDKGGTRTSVKSVRRFDIEAANN